jgi:imidazolonepropionase-like amidohydrolase
MMIRFLYLCVGAVALATGTTPQNKPDSFAIRDVRVFDGERIVPRATVVVGDGVIRAVGPDVQPPAGVQILEGKGRTLIPGLIDAHTHTKTRVQLETALALGVTTQFDMFTPPAFADEMRREQMTTGSRDRADMLSAVTVVTTAGGHGSTGFGFPTPVISSPSEADAFVAARVAEGSDYIKIVVDDFSAYGGKQRPTLMPATVAAVVSAAHKRERLAVVHVARLADAREAVRAGADGLVHVWLDATPPADFLSELQRRRTFVIATLVVWRSRIGGLSAAAMADDPHFQSFLSAEESARLKTAGALKLDPNIPGQFERARESIAILNRAGIRILAGSDTGNPGTAVGVSLHHELALLVEAGLTPAQALASATAVPAEAFRLRDRGRIAVGLRADLVLVEGDPLIDITATRSIVGVWKAGHAFDRAAFATRMVRDRETSRRPKLPVVLSDFEGAKPTAAFGSDWLASSDAIAGGNSQAHVEIVAGGAADSGYALRLSGEVKPLSGEVKPGFSKEPGAGAIYFPGRSPLTPADLSAAQGLRFSARGDGATYRIIVTTGGETPKRSARTFVAGPAWQEQSFRWSDFEIADASAVQSIAIVAGPAAGRYNLLLDQVAIR